MTPTLSKVLVNELSDVNTCGDEDLDAPGVPRYRLARRQAKICAAAAELNIWSDEEFIELWIDVRIRRRHPRPTAGGY